MGEGTKPAMHSSVIQSEHCKHSKGKRIIAHDQKCLGMSNCQNDRGWAWHAAETRGNCFKQFCDLLWPWTGVFGDEGTGYLVFNQYYVIIPRF